MTQDFFFRQDSLDTSGAYVEEFAGQSHARWSSLSPQSMSDCIAICEINYYRFLAPNSQLSGLLGYDVSELQRMTLIDSIYDGDRATVLALLHQLIYGSDPTVEVSNLYEIEAKFRHQQGHTIDGVLRASVVRDQKQRPQHLIVYIEDISSRKESQKEFQKHTEQRLHEALREKETLIQEIHHRVKNNLQVISAILSLQARWVDDAQTAEALHNSRARIQAMAMIHETLYQTPLGLAKVNFATYLQRLVKATVFAHTVRSLPIHTHLNIDPIFLNVETAIPCGLLVNEILMNSLKHAFPDQEQGTITITLRNLPPDHHAQPHQYSLTIQDDGIGLPDTFDLSTIHSVGMSLIRDLTYQLNGVCQLKNQGGAWFQLLFSELPYRKRM